MSREQITTKPRRKQLSGVYFVLKIGYKWGGSEGRDECFFGAKETWFEFEVLFHLFCLLVYVVMDGQYSPLNAILYHPLNIFRSQSRFFSM